MKAIICILTSLLIISPAYAGTAYGVIEQVELGPAYGTKVYIQIAGDIAGQPTCHTNPSYHFAFDIADLGGQGLLSTVLAARAAKQKVRISGYAQCVRAEGVEDLRWLRLEDE